MKDKWELPGKLTEPAGTQLASFGITSIPGARLNMVDPSNLLKTDLWGQLLPEGTKRKDTPRTVRPPTVEGTAQAVRNPYMEDSIQGLEEEAEANRQEWKRPTQKEKPDTF